MTISIIGTGNIAWHLINVFEENDIRIAEIYSRKKKNAESVTGYLYDVIIKTDLDFSNSPSKVFFLAVSDDAIEEVASSILLPENSILVHTSGAKDMKVLLPVLKSNNNISLGVFYPLMTFTKGIKVDFNRIPLCIEGENQQTLTLLMKLAAKISTSVHQISSHNRAVLHVSAVFSCNFVNHLWALGQEIVEEEDLDFELLKPLINETFRKAMKAKHPANVQTGPALRDDMSTIEKHKSIIKEDEDLLKVYTTLTKSIQDWHQ
jgi:predicted short-subunit dehydrogenase-like oxidoreductase (DUF2520 family)